MFPGKLFSNQVECLNPVDPKCKAKNSYPMGSGRLAPYADSWGGGVCMADPTHNQLIGNTYTAVTKISSQTCPDMWSNGDWSGGYSSHKARELWCKDIFKVKLSADSTDNFPHSTGAKQNCVNVRKGGDVCLDNKITTEWPVTAGCAWTRLVLSTSRDAQC